MVIPLTNFLIWSAIALSGATFAIVAECWAERSYQRQRVKRQRANRLSWSCVANDPDQRNWCHRCSTAEDPFRWWPCPKDWYL